ncbi:MAG: AAA family ATPase [Candidatus Diapherotrites archaeon]|nr:AAA family ATPase [Candidatus Diapherotrites archaeon]
MRVMPNLFESKIKESNIFINRDIMLPSYTPKRLPFREKQIEEMVSVLGVAIDSHKPDNLFLYGKPGTGKTSCTKHVLNQLDEFVKNKGLAVKIVYMNCRHYNSKYKVLSRIVQELYPDRDFIGYSGTFIYENLLKYCKENACRLIIGLDEIDKTKDLDELIYALTRANDELQNSSISILGISNQLMFKDRLDPRTKSSLCERELVFPPYNAEELRAILKDRVKMAFKPGVVEESAINLAAAIAAQESGDARTAVMLMLRAAEIAEQGNHNKVTDREVKKAKERVEEEIVMDMICSLPEQQQLVLYAIARLTTDKKGIKKLGNEECVLCSGEVYDEYRKIAGKIKASSVSIRWFQEYINELEMYGLLLTTNSGKGFRGHTRLIKLGFDGEKIRSVLEKHLLA